MTAEKCEAIRLREMDTLGFGPSAMKKVKVCAKCGEAFESADDVCRCCGANLPKETLFDLYRAMHTSCSSCDTVVPKWMRFCPFCGMRLNNQNLQKEESI